MKEKNKTKIIQFTAGRGPAECGWVVAQVLKKFIEEATQVGYDYEVICRDPGPQNGTVQSATVQISGERLDAWVRSWIGTIQWIGTSTFRKFHKRKNWFVGCYELKHVAATQINERDIKFQSMRSKGPGGQHVNKVNSAIRAVHIPTGIQVQVMESRSQHQNKKIATKRLNEKLMEAQIEQMKQTIATQWENHLSVQRGDPVKVFSGTDFKQNRKDNGYKKKRIQLKNDLKKKSWD